MKRFIPLSDVEKPSMQGRVKMYMQRLNEVELATKKQARYNNKDNNADGFHKSSKNLGESGPDKEEKFFSRRNLVGRSMDRTLEPIKPREAKTSKAEDDRFLRKQGAGNNARNRVQTVDHRQVQRQKSSMR